MGGSGGVGAGADGGGDSEEAASGDAPVPIDTAVPPGALPAFCASYPPAAPVAAGHWQSARVRYDAQGKLSYPADEEQNRIPDFSYAGYRYGEAPLPDVPEVARLGPAAGDNTQRIQDALNAVGARALDPRGLRGALLLEPGRYEIRGSLRIDKAGVVLRGSGAGDDPAKDTILFATGDVPHQRTVLVAGSGTAAWSEISPRSDITTPFVQVSAMSFEVASAAGFVAGDPVVIRHPSSAAWIAALGGGGVVMSEPWAPGSRDIVYYRSIRRIEGNTLHLDAPVFNHLDRKLTQSYVAKAAVTHVAQVGVENLRVDIETIGGEDENHAWKGVVFRGAIDSWARNVTVLHFGFSGLESSGGIRVTFEGCRALDPVAVRTGGRMYNFAMEPHAQLVLVRDCEASNGRHSLVGSGASTVSGNVFYRCRMTRGGDVEGGHRQWTQAMLFDNVVETASSVVLLINRGDWGTSHGWGCAHSVAWNFNSNMTIQKPPTAQNYAISTQGARRDPRWPGADGHLEIGKGPNLTPASLYEAQLCERLRRTP